MIHAVVQHGHDYTLRNFCDSWGRVLRERIDILSYADLAHATRLSSGVYLFTDHDRLEPPQVELGATLAEQLIRSGRATVYNHPGQTRQRLRFLQTMFEAGINDFRAFRVVDGWPADLHFPVFLRLENEHKGSLGGLIQSDVQLRDAVAACGHAKSAHLLVVEFCNTVGDDGYHRKYGAMRIGGDIIPRHVFASRDWVVKLNDEVTPAWLEVETDYFRRFAAEFEPQVRAVFDAAQVEYGRLDFSIAAGKLRAWEINTNPMLVNTPDVIHPMRLVSQAESAHTIIRAFEQMDAKVGPTRPPIAVTVPRSLQRALGVGGGDSLLRVAGKALNRLRRLPGVRQSLLLSARARWLAQR